MEMKKITVEQQIYDLIEPGLVKGTDGKYMTADGRKYKIGLLSAIKKIIDEGARVVEVPVEGEVS